MTRIDSRVSGSLRRLAWLAGLIVTALVVATGLITPRWIAPVQSAPAGSGALPADLDLVPRDGTGFVSVNVAECIKSDFGQKLLPRLRKEAGEVLSNIEKELGVPLEEVERITLLVYPEVIIVRTAKPYHRAKLLQALAPKAKETKHKDRTIYVEENRNRSICLIDDRVFVRGRVRDLQRLFDQPAAKDGKGPLSEALGLAAEKNHVVAGLSPKTILTLFYAESEPDASAIPRETLPDKKSLPPPDKELPPIKDKEPSSDCDDKPADKPKEPTVEELLRELPPEFLPYKPLLQAQSATLVLNIGEESKLEARIVCADEELAKDVETATQTALYVLRELVAQWSRELFPSDKGKDTLPALLKQIPLSLKAASVQRKGAVVQASAKLKTDPAAVAEVAAVIERTAQRARSQNNLRQLGIAIHNYHVNLGFMPPPAIYGKNGQALLSWRVALLPWIEDDETGKLYEQFKMDEPWDSEHNKKLLAKMPKVYAPVTGKTKEPGLTYYQVFVGQQTPFVGNIKRNIIQAFPDGTSNTFMVVEAGDPVPWTKPDDLPYDPKKPVPKLGGMFPDGFNVCMGDGSVHFIKKQIDEQTLRALITANGGDVFDWDKVFGGNRRRSRPEHRHNEGKIVPPDIKDPDIRKNEPKEEKPPIKD